MTQPRTGAKVISLDTAFERRENFRDNVRNATFEWEFSSAYRGEVPPLRYDQSLAIRRFGRPLSSGEIGAYTSHYKSWEGFLNSDLDQVVILEDDVVIDCQFINRITQFDFSEHGIDILRMFATHPFSYEMSIQRFCSPHSHLVRCKGLTLGVQAYLLTRRGAEALLKTGTTIFEPVDWVTARYWSYKVPNYSLFPFPVLERYVPSTIGSSREDSYHAPALERAHRFLWRLKNRAFREYVDRIKYRKNRFAPSFDIGQSYIDAEST